MKSAVIPADFRAPGCSGCPRRKGAAKPNLAPQSGDETPPPCRSVNVGTLARLLENGVRAPRGPEASGKRSPSGRVVFCADSEVCDDRKLELGRGAVLPPEVTDQNQPVGEVSPACGSRCPALCPLQTRSPYHVPFGTAAVLRRPDPGPQRNPEKRWSPVRRREGIRTRPFSGECVVSIVTRPRDASS